MEDEKAMFAEECLHLYGKTEERYKQVHPFADACKKFLDAACDYASKYDENMENVLGKYFFHDACKEIINLKWYSYLYSQAAKEREKDIYSDAYYAAEKRLKRYMEIVKEYLEKEMQTKKGET